MTQHDHGRPEDLQEMLTLFKGLDAECLVMCLDEGWVCGSMHSDVLSLSEEELSVYRGLPDSGVRENYIGLFTGTPKFSYYEMFTFHNGHRGMIQKSYDRSKILETFTLSLYDGQGYGYILDQSGDILLRSVPAANHRFYGNVFEALADTHSSQEDIDTLAAALEAQETGSIIFDGDSGRFLYTYTSLDSVDEWTLLSIVPENAISAEADAILQYAQTSLTILAVILLVCAMFIILIWRAQQDIKKKDEAIAYQEQLFDIFATYLANNTNDVYLMLDHGTAALEYVSPNAERVFGVKAENLIEHIRISDLEENPEESQAHYVQVCALKPGEGTKPRSTQRMNPQTGENKYFLETTYCTCIQGHPYDLILLDWKMPTLDGLGTARLIRKNYSDKIPILLLTAYDWSEIEAEAMEIGISHFMPKPFFMSTFKEAIRRVMGSQKREESAQTDVVRGRRILVVDDIEVNRIILVKILSGLGAECDTASNGREAVEAFGRSLPGEYDLILMDVQMPVMDGFTATRTIRGGSHPWAKKIPIVAMTANAFVDDVRDAIEAGMDAHIAKPVQLDKLKSTIQQVLDHRQEPSE